MAKSKWIWYGGDFEIYHAMKQNLRREQYGVGTYVPMWRIDMPRPTALFYKIAVLEKEEKMTAYANGDGYVTIQCDERVPDGKTKRNVQKYNLGEEITLKPGRNFIKVDVVRVGGLPCAYVIGDTFASDSSWSGASLGAGEDYPVGSLDWYTELSDNPEIFKFSYERIYPVASEKINGGTLYDFGKETYGPLIFENIRACGGTPIRFNYGESRAEALDMSDNVPLTDYLDPAEKKMTFKKRAFRYIYVSDDEDISYDISCDYEYIPLEYKGAFRCDDELINKIWDVSAYTLHLNTREGYLDGIKRDGWLWSGDAYQSYYVNYYLFFDNDSIKRTIIGLRGNEPTTQHTNTILDYSFYWICSVYDYYFHTGDMDFVRFIYPKMKTMMAFIETRCDERGIVRGKRGDWTFIDWTTFDTDGPQAAEQMLLIHTYRTMAKCAALMGEDMSVYEQKAERLYRAANELFWDEEKGAFIDSYTSGKRHVTRHANIFALLFDTTSEERKERIIRDVINNKDVPPITTPYFEFFELDAMCMLGDRKYMLDMLHSYWGGMIKLGATTIWEQFDPNEEGAEHYRMYGKPYGRSLCHAWGASPIYLLGKYILGVKPTSPAYKTFDVAPSASGLTGIHGRVPLPCGYVDVEINGDEVSVYSTCEGGTLILGDEKFAIEKDKKITKTHKNA